MTALEEPIVLGPNPVARFYRGAGALAAFRRAAGLQLPGDASEDWVGSVTRAWRPAGAAATDEGLSRVPTGDGATALLAELIAASPDAALGAPRAAAWAGSTGVLVKLLDAGERLPIHCHPSRGFARRMLGSPFGKAEAWIVLGTRRLPGREPPHIRLGFAGGLGAARLADVIAEQEIGALLELMPPIEVRPGDAWFVPPGVAHAIGPGVFMVEVQEPADFSIVAERAGFPIGADEANLGLGWATMLEAFDLDPMTPERLGGLRMGSGDSSTRGGVTRKPLLSGDALRYFVAERLEVSGSGEWPVHDRFAVGIVVAGRGRLGPVPLTRGTTFAVSVAAAAHLAVVGEPRVEMVVATGGDEPPAP